MLTLDPDYLPRPGFWEGLSADLASRGALAWGIASLYALVAIGSWVIYVHWVRKRAAHMPIRILVAGTRGKSSVVRLLHGALRQAGYRVTGKTTGTAARVLAADGTERPMRRIGQISILETVASMSWAIRHGADALVTECMAVNPGLISQLSADIVRPTVVDITNAELDHLEEEGTDRRAIMRSLSLAIHGQQIVVTSERDPLAIWDLQQRCAQARATLLVVDRSGSVSREGTPFVEGAYPENVALSLATTRACGIPDAIAIAGMRGASHEPQENEVVENDVAGMSVTFCNLGAINDADNVIPAVSAMLGYRPTSKPRIAVVCGRSDRPMRAMLFAGLLSPKMFDAVVVSGGPEAMVARELRRSGWAADRVMSLGLLAYFTRLVGRRLNTLARRVDPECAAYEIVALENVHVPIAASLHRLLSGAGLGRGE